MVDTTFRFDGDICYVNAGDFTEKDYMDYVKSFREKLVQMGYKEGDNKNLNIILDFSAHDPNVFPPNDITEVDYRRDHRNVEARDGKYVIVISKSKGGHWRFDQIFRPDAIVYSIEDAEKFIKEGILIDRDGV